MSNDGAMMPAVAPGSWTVATNAGKGQEVRVVLESAQGAAAIATQLDKWNAALVLTKCPSVVLPTYVRRDSTPTLHFNAPLKVGTGLEASPKPPDILATLRTLALALDRLHAHGLIHGALAFPSLWWTEANRIQFPDAGLARALDGLVRASSDIYNYRAPELWHGRAPIPASDQYSLAVMAYELFTGRTRSNPTTVEGLVSIEPIMLEPKALHDAGVPVGIAEVLQRALSSTPQSRYANCLELIEAVASQLKEHSASGFVERRRSRRRLSGPMLAVGSMAVIAIGGGMYAAANQDDARALMKRTQARVSKISDNNGELLVPVPAVQSSAGITAVGSAARRTEQMARSAMEKPGAATNPQQVAGQAPSTTALRRGVLFSEAVRGPAPLPPPYRDPSFDVAEIDNPLSSPEARALAARTSQTIADAMTSLAAELDSATPRIALTDGSAASTGTVNGVAAAILDAARAAETASPDAATSSSTRSAATQNAGVPNGGTSAKGGSANPGGTPKARAASGTISSGYRIVDGAQPPKPKSTMSVIAFTIPESSRLYIDGQLIRQRSKAMLAQPGLHDIVVLTNDGATVRRRVNVAAGDTAFVRVP